MRRPNYQPKGFCPRCSYPMDPGRCPECGLLVSADVLSRKSRVTLPKGVDVWIISVAVFSILHYLLAFACAVLALKGGLFSSAPPTLLSTMSGILLDCLSAIDLVFSHLLGPMTYELGLDSIISVVNSLVYGAICACLFHLWRGRKRGRAG